MYIDLEYISTKLKFLVGDANRQNFTHTGSYSEDIDSYLGYINQASEFLREYVGFNFCYTVSLKRDAQV